MFRAIASQAEHGHALAERVRDLITTERRAMGPTSSGRLVALVADLMDALATYDHHGERSLKRPTA